MSWTKLLSLLLILLAGCAAQPADSGFGDVQTQARVRTGAAIRWNHDSAADREVADRLGGMLSRQISPDDAVQIALLNNPRLQARYEQLGIAQADLVAAGLLKNPVFDGMIRWPDDGGGPNVELAVTGSFLDILFIPLRQRIAKAELEKTKLEVADAVFDLATRTRQAYFQLQGAQQLLELQQTVLAAEQAAAETSQKLQQAGNINQLDADSEQAMFAQVQLDVISSQAGALAAREKLAALMGMPDAGDQIHVIDRLADLPAADESLEQLQKRATGDRLDLAAARAQITALEQSLGLVSKDRGVLSDAQIGIDTEREPNGQRVTGPTFSIPIPLFNFGQASVARAQHQLRAAEQDYLALRNETRSEVRQTYQQMLAARQRAVQERTVVLPLRQRIVEQSQLHYNGMLLGIFQLLEAKQAEIQSGRSYVESLRDYWIARTDLERAVGGRLSSAPTTQSSVLPPPTTGPTMDSMHHHHP